MPGRTGRQCRDRYQNYLIPGFFNGQWSRQEDELLMRKYMELGSQWSKITQFFTNRSANSLKNRWNYFVSRHLNDIVLQNHKNNVANSYYNDKLDLKNDVVYEGVMNFTNSLDFVDLETTIDNDDFVIKDEFMEYPFTPNDNGL